MEYLRRFTAAHTRLKAKIHGARIPLSPRGRKVMAFVYFMTPVVAGYYIMDWATGRNVSPEVLQAIEERREQDASRRGGQNFAASGLSVVEDAHRDSSSSWAEHMDGMRRRPSVPTGEDGGEESRE